jgi:hypothetical protein
VKHIHAYNWVAQVARLLPEATFQNGTVYRDGKRRIIIHVGSQTGEFVIDDITPESAAETMKGLSL